MRDRRQDRALGITLHTGWGACVIVGGSLREPEVFTNEIIEIRHVSQHIVSENQINWPLGLSDMLGKADAPQLGEPDAQGRIQYVANAPAAALPTGG